MLAGDVFRKGGVDDYFGNEEYRKICYVSDSAMDDRQGDGLDEYHNEIKFMTAPMLAFVEIKVRSLLSGQKSLPANDRSRDRIITQYEEIVRQLRTVHSDYVTVKRVPRSPLGTPGSQSATPAGAHPNIWA
ncbi:TPA: hypothetical protein ACH3X1_016442 [Trebouxia sp. C0004]